MFKVGYKIRRKEYLESEPFVTLGQAERLALEVAKLATVVTVLKESDGSDHPDNKGKYFLHRIIK